MASHSEPFPPAAREKERLRAAFDRYRRGLDANAYERLSREALARAGRLPELREARVVHVYWPLVERRELDTRPLIEALRNRGAEIVLPVVASFEAGTPPVLRHVCHPGEKELQVNRWGISEPPPGESVRVEDIDAVVVPALGAGRNRHRIGYGKGFYDAFLRQVTAPTICLVYDACLVDRVPNQPHDVAMRIVVTEHETVR